MWLSNKTQIIGIDIGSHSVKVVQLLKKKKRFELMNLGMIPLPENTFIDGMTENPKIVSEAIKQLISCEKIKTKFGVTSISGESVIIKKISIPKMNEEELAESIQLEAEQYIPFDIHDVNLDFKVLGKVEKGPGEETEEDAGEQIEVLLVAAKKDIIEQRESILRDAGIRGVVVDLDIFAVENSYSYNYDMEKDKVISIINAGLSVTNIDIMEKGKTVFTRDILVGGAQYNEAIQKQLNVDYENAERMKLGVDASEENKSKIISIIVDSTNALASEIQKSIEFYSTAANRNVDKILLSGGSAKLSGINQLLNEKLGVEIETLDSLKKIPFNRKKFDPEYLADISPVMAVAVGLAFRRFDDND